MTFQPVPIASAQFDQLADDVPGFTSDEQLLKDTLQTSIFVSGASSSSDGRASYILGNDGERLWLPNTSFWTVSGSVAAGATLVMSLCIKRINRDVIW